MVGRASERAEFLTWVDSRLRDAEAALHNGDVGPRSELWSTRDPVTVFGAWLSGSGHEEVSRIFHEVGQRLSNCVSFSQEIVAADVHGELAYTVGYEHIQAAVNGEPTTYSLRVTQVYRREDGEWKVVHRHGDAVTEQES